MLERMNIDELNLIFATSFDPDGKSTMGGFSALEE